MLRNIFVLITAFVMVVGCASTEKVYKPIPQSPAYPLELSWANVLAQMGSDRYTRLLPAVTDESIIVADVDGNVSVYSTETGELQWQKNFQTVFSAGPNVYGEIAFIGNKDAEVYAVNITNGALIWKQTVSSEILVPPQLGKNMLVVQTNDGKVYGLGADDGSIIWVYGRSVPILSLRGNSTPVIINDEEVVVGLASGKLVSLSLVDGKLLWETTISLAKGRTELERIVDIDGPIVYSQGVVYVAAYRGRVAAVDAESGGILWARELSSYLGVVVDGSLLYVTDDQGRVWALDKDGGATLWMQDKLSERANTRPAVLGDNLIIGDVTGELYWLAKADGRLLGHLSHYRVSEFSGATFFIDELDGEEEPNNDPTSVVYQANVVDQQVYVTYQNGILASIKVQENAEN